MGKVDDAVSGLSQSFYSWMSCLEEAEIGSFPTITLNLDGGDLVLTPYQYLLDYEGFYYWGLDESSVPIIGNVALQDYFVVFDMESDRVGFATGVCEDASLSLPSAPSGGHKMWGPVSTTEEEVASTTQMPELFVHQQVAAVMVNGAAVCAVISLVAAVVVAVNTFRRVRRAPSV